MQQTKSKMKIQIKIYRTITDQAKDDSKKEEEQGHKDKVPHVERNVKPLKSEKYKEEKKGCPVKGTDGKKEAKREEKGTQGSGG